MRGWIQRFFYGRYGYDQLNWCLLFLYLFFLLITMVTDLVFFHVLSLGCGLFAVFRLLSRNFPRRRAENAAFLRVAGPALRNLKLWKTMLRDKEHRYFKCPGCGQRLRVPRGKGRISINCRSCGAAFERNT